MFQSVRSGVKRLWPDKTPQEESDELEALGYKGALADQQFSYLRDQGYRGTLIDMLSAFHNDNT